MRLTILGCGPSGGVPGISYGWGKCDKNNPKNQRLRPSALVETDSTKLLIDTAPDLREQLLRANVSKLDGVLFSHFHADHVHGIDDLRSINKVLHAPLDVYGDDITLAAIGKRFGYVFEPLVPGSTVYYKPVLTPHTLHDGDRLTLGDIETTVFEQDHGYSTSLGFRFGENLAFSTDVVNLPETSFAHLEGVKVWVIGVLHDQPLPTHAHVDKALEWIERVKPERAVLTHLGPGLDYDALAKRLPAGVEPAYDGMVIDV